MTTILIERIKELEIDSPNENLIAREWLYPPRKNEETKLKSMIPDDIGIEDKFNPFNENIKLSPTISASATIQANLQTNEQNIIIRDEAFFSVNRSSRLNPPKTLIQDIPITKAIDNLLSDNNNTENDPFFLEKSVVGQFLQNFLANKI